MISQNPLTRLLIFTTKQIAATPNFNTLCITLYFKVVNNNKSEDVMLKMRKIPEEQTEIQKDFNRLEKLNLSHIQHV